MPGAYGGNMKRVIFILLLVLANILFAGELKKLSFEQAFLNKGEKLLKPMPRVIGWADNEHYFELKDMQLFKVDARSGKAQPAADSSKYMALFGQGLNPMSASDRSSDLSKMLFVKDGDIFFFDAADGTVLQITKTDGTEENPTFSADATKIAYTMGGNLFVYDTREKKSLQLTDDGSEDILNGYASWVYYEEVLGRGSNYRAFWWSPDNLKLVFIRFDQTKVPVFPIFHAQGDYGDLEKQRYPKPGYPNPEVKIGTADVTSGKVEWIPFEDKDEHYLAFPRWNDKSDAVYFQWLNRDQNHFKILRYQLAAKTITTAYEEKQKTWIDLLEESDLKILAGGDLLIRSSHSGWYHLYLVSAKGKIRPLTSGDWSVNGIELVNEKKKLVFFTAAKEDSTQTDFYRVGLNGKGFKRLTADVGMHFVNVSPDGRYFTDSYSSINQPARMDLRDRGGKFMRRLGDSYSPVLETYQLAKKEMFKIKTEDGYELPAVWMLPPDFDKTKKYPVIMSIYGGPGAGTVRNFYTFRGWGMHYLAQEGIIVINVDHRGSGHFGKKGMDLMHRNFGKWEMHDYIEAVKYLRTLPFVDSEKIGITGGSYGGYVTALALTYGSEYFKYGIAGASVIDWALYDSIYTERYMDTPKDNPEGYKNASVLTYIDKYKSGSLMITHGTIDDNVHLQNTLQFLDKVQDAGKIVELMLFPGERHGVRKKREASNKIALDFWLRKFFGRTFTE